MENNPTAPVPPPASTPPDAKSATPPVAATPAPLPEGAPASAEAPPAKSGRPKWEDEARARLRGAVRRMSKQLGELKARDANEGDTRLFVTDFLCEALGYDKFADLTTEYIVRADFADYGIRIDQQMVAFLEVKRITTDLSAKHLRQVESYALNEGLEWVFLTNGAAWQAYHVTAAKPVVTELALEVDLLSSAPMPKKLDALFYLTRESLKRRQIDSLWQERKATSPAAFGEVLRSEAVLDAIRREVRRRTGFRVEPAEIARLLRETCLRDECQ